MGVVFAEEVPDGQIACLSGEDMDTFQVHILDLKSKTEKTINKGESSWSTSLVSKWTKRSLFCKNR
jgi:hypothetical protein